MTYAEKTEADTEQLPHCLTEIHMLWCLGDWQSLGLLLSQNQQNITNEQKLYLAAGLYQLGHIQEAEKLLLEIELTPKQKKLAAKLLISGTYNALGKAYACTNDYDLAEKLCKKSLLDISNEAVSIALLNARISEQFSQLGIPRLAENISPASFKPDAEKHLKISSKYFPHEPAQQIALAEFYQLNEQYDNAIVHWQTVSGLLNTETPQLYYDRLKDAYKSIKGFPQGTLEQETLRGDTDKHRLLSEIHKRLQPEFYFEIGVQTGKSLALAKCEAVGIDPMPMLNVELPKTTKVISSSSDNFFKRQSDLLLKKTIDLCFIDGMHLFEYALRDFINVEKYAQPHSLIVIDDIFPGHPDQAKRERCTRAWTGDVWKVKDTLERYRPDLFILSIDAYPTGLLLISALNPNNSVLIDNYEAILHNYSVDALVPDASIQRKGSISGSSEAIYNIVNTLNLTRHQKTDASTLKIALEQLVSQQSKQ